MILDSDMVDNESSDFTEQSTFSFISVGEGGGRLERFFINRMTRGLTDSVEAAFMESVDWLGECKCE